MTMLLSWSKTKQKQKPRCLNKRHKCFFDIKKHLCLHSNNAVFVFVLFLSRIVTWSSIFQTLMYFSAIILDPIYPFANNAIVNGSALLNFRSIEIIGLKFISKPCVFIVKFLFDDKNLWERPRQIFHIPPKIFVRRMHGVFGKLLAYLINSGL